MSESRWQVDVDDPRAPPHEVWERMTAAQREAVVAALPTGMPLELAPPEGDRHRKPKEKARDALDEFFRRVGRQVYVSSELVTYYPGEPRFCPDILAVLDVPLHERSSWMVDLEGKGLDVVIEIHVSGEVRKDFERNVLRYAKLGIPEYFIFDRTSARILGYRLRAGANSYERLVPQRGKISSQVLGLELAVEAGLLRFYHGTAPLLFSDELVGKLDGLVAELVEARDAAVRGAAEEAQRAAEEAQRAEQAERRTEALESELQRLRAELERLKR